MSEPRDTTSIFLHQQTPTDFSRLKNVMNILPCNLDGVTERLGQFLVLELKHGETLSVGQSRMLQAAAAIPQFTVLIVSCQWSPANEKGGRDFNPESFRVMGTDGALGPEYETNYRAFAVRYDIWCRTPKHGPRPFTCSLVEFQKEYLPWLPSDQQPRALSALENEAAADATASTWSLPGAKSGPHH
jgi:hypothetical protein